MGAGVERFLVQFSVMHSCLYCNPYFPSPSLVFSLPAVVLSHSLRLSLTGSVLSSIPLCFFLKRPDRRESNDFFFMGSIDTGGITQVCARAPQDSRVLAGESLCVLFGC